MTLRSNRSTLTQFLIEERRRFPNASGDFNALILDVALACKGIARAVAYGELTGMMGNHAADAVARSMCRVRPRISSMCFPTMFSFSASSCRLCRG